MTPAVQSRPATAGPSQVGFRFRLQNFTPESPCAVPGQVVCTREDTHLWIKHAEQWIAAVASLAKTQSERAAVEKRAKMVHAIEKRNCFLGCGSDVNALVSICQYLKMLAESWGHPVVGLETDWGWSFPIPWGIPNWMKEAKKQWDKVTSWGQWIPIAVIAFLLLNNRRKGSWL